MSGLNQDGYATPAAAVISMAIALVAAAVVNRGVLDLRLARAELNLTQTEYRLDAAHNAAMLAISTSSQPPPYRWTFSGLGPAVAVVAEPEYLKMTPQRFAELDDATFARLGILDPEPVRASLRLGHDPTQFIWIADKANAPVWRACAPMMISPFGKALDLVSWTYAAPKSGLQPSAWRAGEVWRIRVTDAAGWRDERVVRFSGNGLKPASVIGRRLSRGWIGEQRCEDLFGDSAAT